MRLFKTLHRYVSKALSGQHFRKSRNEIEYIFTGDYYRSLAEKYDSAEQYLGLLKELEKRCPHYTRKNIGAQTYFSEELDRVKLIRSLGEPVFICKNPMLPEVELYFFKTELGGMRTGIEGHFFNGRLFMFNYVFPQVNRVSLLRIMNVLNDKYHLNLNHKELNEIAIYDDENNSLLLHYSGLVFHTIELSYLDNSSPFWKRAELAQIKKSEENLGKIISHEKELYKKL